MPENAEVTRTDRTCNEIQGFELDDEQKTTACFQLNKEVVCLLQYLLLMVIELRATYVLNIFTPITSLIPNGIFRWGSSWLYMALYKSVPQLTNCLYTSVHKDKR